MVDLLEYLVHFIVAWEYGIYWPLDWLPTFAAQLTYCMVQSPSWEANWFTASQEIPRISRNPKVQYRTHKRPPSVSILRQPTSWRSILILSAHLRLGLLSGLLPSGFHTKTLYTPLSSPIRATCPAHLILLDFINRTILGEEYKSFSSLLCCLFFLDFHHLRLFLHKMSCVS